MTDSGSDRVVRAIVELYTSPAAEALYDEVVTERDHALQTAGLAIADHADDALVVAALLHDVGHLLAVGTDDRTHDLVGARFARQWFGPAVSSPIELHVAAKRYLCGADPRYHDDLSPASVASLRWQGGPMDPAEQAAFLEQPYASDAIRLRRYDDLAKVPGAKTPPLDSFLELIARVAAEHV